MTFYSVFIDSIFFCILHIYSILCILKSIFLMIFIEWNKIEFIDIIFKKIIDILRKSIFLPIIIGKKVLINLP